MHQSIGRIVVGLGIVLLGVLILLENLDLIEARHLFRYWPVLLIGYGAYQLLTPGAGKGFGLLVLVVGAVLLSNAMDLTNINLWELWPVLIILLGLSLIFRSRSGRGPTPAGGETVTDGFVSGTAILGGFNRKVNTDDFRGASLTAVMGGCEIDLTGASMKEPRAVVDVFAFWGGIDLRIPASWQVQVEVTPILGGVDDKTHRATEGSTGVLVLRGQAIMGGVEISN